MASHDRRLWMRRGLHMRHERPIQQTQVIGDRVVNGGDVVDVRQGGEVRSEDARAGAVPAVDNGVSLQQIDQHGVRARVGQRSPQHEDVAAPDSVMIRFTTSLPRVDGTCTMFRYQFLGLCLYCYDEPLENGRAEGPRRLRGTARPTHPPSRFAHRRVGTQTEPACLWEPGPLLQDMYCFQRLRSGVMVGPSHAERTAAHNAAPRCTPITR